MGHGAANETLKSTQRKRVERETGFEPATCCLEGSHSTAELLPRCAALRRASSSVSRVQGRATAQRRPVSDVRRPWHGRMSLLTQPLASVVAVRPPSCNADAQGINVRVGFRAAGPPQRNRPTCAAPSQPAPSARSSARSCSSSPLPSWPRGRSAIAPRPPRPTSRRRRRHRRLHPRPRRPRPRPHRPRTASSWSTSRPSPTTTSR